MDDGYQSGCNYAGLANPIASCSPLAIKRLGLEDFDVS